MPRKAVRFHSGCSIHLQGKIIRGAEDQIECKFLLTGIPPHIISESLQTQNASDYRPNMNTGSQGELEIVLLVYFLQRVEEINDE